MVRNRRGGSPTSSGPPRAFSIIDDRARRRDAEIAEWAATDVVGSGGQQRFNPDSKAFISGLIKLVNLHVCECPDLNWAVGTTRIMEDHLLPRTPNNLQETRW